jgi:hypothetical protein
MTGTDEHGQKIAEKAALEGVDPIVNCDRSIRNLFSLASLSCLSLFAHMKMFIFCRECMICFSLSSLILRMYSLDSRSPLTLFTHAPYPLS